MEKRCLFGFVAKTEGLTFETPVTVSLPVPSLAEGERVIWTDIDEEAGTYYIPDADLAFRGEEGIVDVSLEHFSSKGLIACISKEYVRSDDLPDCCNTEKYAKMDPKCCCIQFEQIQKQGDMIVDARPVNFRPKTTIIPNDKKNDRARH